MSNSSASAQAQLYRGSATARVGSTLGGDAPGAALTLGGSISVQEDSGWGSEIDYGFANSSKGGGHEADLTTALIGVNWIKPSGPWHPFAMAGVGAIGVHGCLLPCSRVTSTWNFAIGGGAGAHYDLTDLVAVSGDVRYFMAPGRHTGSSRPENFGFFRVALGVTVTWAIVP